MEASEQKESRTLWIIVIIYALVFTLKLVIYFFTGVMALLAEALHTLSDLFISTFLLIALVWSRRKADRDHMFGYRRAQNVAALVAATLFISFTSLRLFEEAIPRLLSHETHTYSNLWLALAVLIFSFVIAAVPIFLLSSQEKKGAASKAQLMELFNDELGVLAALAGTVGIMRGYSLADPIASLVVAVIIALNAVKLFKENMNLLIGVSPGEEYLEKVKEIAAEVKGVRGIRDIKAEYIGPDLVHIDFHVMVDSGITVDEADLITEQCCSRVREFTNSRFITAHTDVVKPPPARG